MCDAHNHGNDGTYYVSKRRDDSGYNSAGENYSADFGGNN